MKFVTGLLAAAVLCLSTGAAIAATPASPSKAASAHAYSLEDFLRRERFLQVKISPGGTYAAATVPLEDKTVLVILKPGQKTPYGYVNFKEKNTHVVNFSWVNDNRVLFTVGEKNGALEQPVSFGEIWGTNADGTRQGILVGARASTSAASRAGGRSKSQAASFFLVDTLPKEDDFVLIGSTPFDAGEAPYTSVERMNVNSGTKTSVARAPVRGASFLADHAGVVRFASGENKDFKSVLLYRADEHSDWKLLNDESVSGKKMDPLDFDRDDHVAYVQSSQVTGPDAVLSFDPATLSMRQIARDEFVDPEGLIDAIGQDYPIGVAFRDGKPRFQYFNPESPEARLHKSLQNSFGGDVVTSDSHTRDGTQALLLARSDRNPGDYFVFNTQTKKADILISRRDWFDPETTASVRPFRFTARDGRKIEAFLTVPNGSDGKRLPLIVNPHGGPFGPYDEWGFHTEPQLLASQGYAVLQVNYRGSGGYGKEFLESGHKQWGKTMQDDLTDATRWAIKEGVADPARICMYGASYGGYASLMAVAKEPDLYRCAAGYVGVYDLNMLSQRGDIPGSEHGKRFLEEAVGKNDLAAASPSTLASRIKVPVFLAAGGEDKRAPQAQSEAMERALKSAGVPVETLYYPTEGHGFYTVEHKREFYTRLLAFLAKNLRGGNAEGSGLLPVPAQGN